MNHKRPCCHFGEKRNVCGGPTNPTDPPFCFRRNPLRNEFFFCVTVLTGFESSFQRQPTNLATLYDEAAMTNFGESVINVKLKENDNFISKLITTCQRSTHVGTFKFSECCLCKFALSHYSSQYDLLPVRVICGIWFFFSGNRTQDLGPKDVSFPTNFGISRCKPGSGFQMR